MARWHFHLSLQERLWSYLSRSLCQCTAAVPCMWFDSQFMLSSTFFVLFIPTGKIWEECKEIWSQDFREYISELWNLLDFSILAIFMTSFIARLMAFWHAYSAQCYVDKHHTDLSSMNLPSEIQYFQLGKCQLKNTLYGVVFQEIVLRYVSN